MTIVQFTLDIGIVLGLLGLTVLLTLSNVVRVDVVGILVLVILGITQLLPPEQLFSGFSSEAVISLIAIMIISSGLEKSGMAARGARWILRLGKEHSSQISVILMVISGLLSAFMRSLGTVALLLPVVTKISVRTGISKSRLLMPVAFCSIIGGTLSMVGSSALILLNSLFKNSTHYLPDYQGTLEPFHLFSVFPIGAMLLSATILYFWTLGKRLLPQVQNATFNSGTTKAHFFKTYGKGAELFECQILESSPLIGLSLQEVESRLDPVCSILSVISGTDVHFPPLRRITLKKDDYIAIMGQKDLVTTFSETYGLLLMPTLNVFSELLHPVRSGLCEAVIPPSSQLIGLELRELHMKRNHQVHVLAVYRGQTVYRGDELKSLVLRSGDTLGMYSRWDALADFHKNPDFVVVTTAYPREELRPNKVKFALSFFALAIGLIVIGKYPVSVGLLVGACGMIATGVLSIDEAYDSVSWKTVFLMAGLIPLGLVMQSTHTTDWLTQHSGLLTAKLPDWGMQLILAGISTLFAFVISGVGATIVLVPIAIDLAITVGADPRIYALIIAIASTNSFLMPNQQANTLIAGPGGYATKDFIRVGGLMSILYIFVMIAAIHLWLI